MMNLAMRKFTPSNDKGQSIGNEINTGVFWVMHETGMLTGYQKISY
jgi:hypothetical protein